MYLLMFPIRITFVAVTIAAIGFIFFNSVFLLFCLFASLCLFSSFLGGFFCEVGEEYFTEYLVNWSSKVQLFIYDTTELVEILISEALGSQDGSHLVIQFSLKQSRCFRMTGFHFFFNHGHTIWDKLKFSCEIAQCGKRSISICKKSFASTDKRLGTKL